MRTQPESRSRRRLAQKRRQRRRAVMLASLILVLAVGAVGGTLAWLTDETGEVKNTFTAGDINIALEETTTQFKMVPGNTIAKDPKVTVEAGSEACWLFVKVDKSENFDTFMTCTMAGGWTELSGATGVYYCEVAATAADTPFAVLADNQVTVKNTVTKAQLNALTETTRPTLTFTAYAVQKDNITTAAAAWEIAKQTT